MVMILNKQRIGPLRRQHADGFSGCRPSGQPLDAGAEPVCAAENQMIAVGLGQRPLDGGAAALHLLAWEARVLGRDDLPDGVWERCDHWISCVNSYEGGDRAAVELSARCGIIGQRR